MVASCFLFFFWIVPCAVIIFDISYFSRIWCTSFVSLELQISLPIWVRLFIILKFVSCENDRSLCARVSIEENIHSLTPYSISSSIRLNSSAHVTHSCRLKSMTRTRKPPRETLYINVTTNRIPFSFGNYLFNSWFERRSHLTFANNLIRFKSSSIVPAHSVNTIRRKKTSNRRERGIKFQSIGF